MKSEKQKMLAGDVYNPMDSELRAGRRRARELFKSLNDSYDREKKRRKKLIQELFGSSSNTIWIEPPFYCDYGTNIVLGENVFLNFNCTILDPANINIGDNVLIGPGVHIYSSVHPLSAAERREGLETAMPVNIGADVWIGGNVTICPGVSIGERSVIGAGSVVTKDIPADVVAAGNPCRVIRQIDIGS